MAGISQVNQFSLRNNEMNVTVLIEIDRITNDGSLIIQGTNFDFEIDILIQSESCKDSPTFKSFEQSLTSSFAERRNYDRVKMSFTSKYTRFNLVTC